MTTKARSDTIDEQVAGALEDDPRELRLNIRLKHLEAAKLDHARGDMSRSDFARQAIMAACDGRQGAAPAIHAEDLRIIKATLFKLGKLSRYEMLPLLVELVRLVHEHTVPAPSPDAELEARKQAERKTANVLQRIGIKADDEGNVVTIADLQQDLKRIEATLTERLTERQPRRRWFTRKTKENRR